MLSLWEYLRPARHKLLAHNDLGALRADDTLGDFPYGEDKNYFKALQEIVNQVHDRWGGGGPYPFDDLAKNDVMEFLGVLERSGQV